MSFVTFGEILLRLTSSTLGEKIYSVKELSVDYAGAEANVASSLAILGNKVAYVTKLPSNQLGDAAMGSLKAYGVDTSKVVRGGKRLGIYFIEHGSSIRPSKVIYDREDSSISKITKGELDWGTILKNSDWLFLSGITPALSEQCAQETILAAKTAKKLGVNVAFDLNYRRSLWKNAEDAKKIFDEILEHTDLLFGNTGSIKDVYGIEGKGKNLVDRTMDVSNTVMEELAIPQVAFTVRDHISASTNVVSSVYTSKNLNHVSPQFKIDILDRFGAGDAFAAAFLHALHKGWVGDKVSDFATVAFALKHTLKGDHHTSTEDEIVSIMEGNTGGRVIR